MLIKNALIINEHERYKANIFINGERIAKIIRFPSENQSTQNEISADNITDNVIDADGMLVLPGIIDSHVHFRQPGLTHKGNIFTESRAGIAGGVTSYIDMPNTIPQTVTVDSLNEKFNLAAEYSMANYSFMIGATNNNFQELIKNESQRAIAIKIFMGASTGNMLVDNKKILEKIFAETNRIIVAHCEDEQIIKQNKERLIKEYGENLDVTFHPKIRNEESCYKSSEEAILMAIKHNSRLHIAHLSTAKELTLLNDKSITGKRITAEACIHHLWFTDEDYISKGNNIKWNPAIKTRQDRDELRNAVITGKIDTIATDHAPHTVQEKITGPNFPSGGPMIQHSLQVMLELCRKGILTEEVVVEKMSHNPAILFGIKDRGFIREGYYADIILVNPNTSYTVSNSNILYKCGWSPMLGETFTTCVEKTIINGRLACNNGEIDDTVRGKEIEI
jgi:dihydroorotase